MKKFIKFKIRKNNNILQNYIYIYVCDINSYNGNHLL